MVPPFLFSLFVLHVLNFIVIRLSREVDPSRDFKHLLASSSCGSFEVWGRARSYVAQGFQFEYDLICIYGKYTRHRVCIDQAKTPEQEDELLRSPRTRTRGQD